MLAAMSFIVDALSRWSKPNNPARCANHNSNRKLIQAPTEVASARPIWANVPISATLSATLTTTDAYSALTGVAVSPRARNVAVMLRSRTNGSSPTE